MAWGPQITALALFVASTAAGGVASAGLLGPSNYEECILDSMKGVTSDAAAYSIRQACRKKFPSDERTQTARELRELAREELALLTISEGRYVVPLTEFSTAQANKKKHKVSGMSFQVHNASENVTVGELTVSISSASSPKALEYRASCDIAPKSAAQVNVFFLPTEQEGFSWSVVAGRGSE